MRPPTPHPPNPPALTLRSSSDLGPYIIGASSILMEVANFQTASGASALHSDVASWQAAWFSTQTALPTEVVPSEPGNNDLSNAFQLNYVQKMVDLMEKKQYMTDKAGQSSALEVFKDYQTILREVAGSYVSQLTETAKSTETTAKSAETTAKSAETTAAAGAKEEEEEEEEKKDEDNAAGRVGGVGALAAVLVSGLLAVVAL